MPGRLFDERRHTITLLPTENRRLGYFCRMRFRSRSVTTLRAIIYSACRRMSKFRITSLIAFVDSILARQMKIRRQIFLPKYRMRSISALLGLFIYLFFFFLQERRVIRFRKSLPGEVSPDGGETRAQREVWYARNVVSCFLGSYAHIPEIACYQAADIAKLSDAIRPHRPGKIIFPRIYRRRSLYHFSSKICPENSYLIF